MNVQGDFGTSARKKGASRKGAESNIYFTLLYLPYCLCNMNAYKGFKTVHSDAVNGQSGNSSAFIVLFYDKSRKIVFIICQHLRNRIIYYYGGEILCP